MAEPLLMETFANGGSLRLVIGWLIVTGCGGATVRPPPADASEVPDASATSPGDDASCLIQASNFDQSCSVDSDCVSLAGQFPVTSGNYCASICPCPADAINRAAIGTYIAAVSQTPYGMGALPIVGCNCAAGAGPCCVAGQCSTSCPTPCSQPPCSTDNNDSGGPDLDATAALVDGGVLCSSEIGPLDASSQFGDADVYGCGPLEPCVPYNGGWACCMKLSPDRALCRQAPINK